MPRKLVACKRDSPETEDVQVRSPRHQDVLVQSILCRSI